MQHGRDENPFGNRRLFGSTPAIEGNEGRVKRKGTTNGGEEIFFLVEVNHDTSFTLSIY